MTNSTPDYWSVDGVSLQTVAWGIDRWGGSLEGVANRRGSTLTIPHRPGQSWKPQVTDARTLTFAMWVLPCDPDGVTPAGAGAQEAQLLENWALLRDLFWGSGTEQLQLTKRWGGGFAAATGQAVFAGGLEPIAPGMGAARFTVDLFLADPYLYGAPDSAVVTTAGAVIDNVGDDPCARLTLAFSGSSSGDYVLSNATTGETLTVANTGTIAVDTWDFTAVKAGNSVLGNVSSTGKTFWMSLARGENTLDINQHECQVTWAPVYL